MKKFFVTAVIGGALFFSVESATAQVTEDETQTTEQQTDQQTAQQTTKKKDFNKVEEQDLPTEVRDAVERDFQGSAVSEAYVKEKNGSKKYKLVLTTEQGESKEVYADGKGNWIDKKKKDKE